MQTQKQLTIGETSALCAVSVRMLRHWESMRHAGSVDLHIMSGRSVQIMQTQKQLTIGETSALCAVSVRMLRHWESMGLLHPTRDSNGYRLYSEDDIARIRRIRLYRDLGLTTDQIRAETTSRVYGASACTVTSASPRTRSARSSTARPRKRSR